MAFSYDIPFYLRWTVDELKDMIALLKRADFDPTDIDTDLHKRVADAIQDGFIRRFDMRVNSRDGDQDLSMWMRDVEEVVREIMRDERFKATRSSALKQVWRITASVSTGARQTRRSPFRLVKSGDVHPMLFQVITGYPRLS